MDACLETSTILGMFGNTTGSTFQRSLQSSCLVCHYDNGMIWSIPDSESTHVSQILGILCHIPDRSERLTYGSHLEWT